MTPLIDRIRAYVAAIPTHYCFQCSEDVVSVDGGCPNCGKDWIPEKLTESHANALLREVAALEPVAGVYIDLHIGTALCRPGNEMGPRLYTLTGATHDSE